jgi:hypothetical protein
MFFATLGVIASSIERLATEIRHLQRTEVLEAEEYFSPGQKGSSAMPHKRNPVLTENLTGLARMVREAMSLPAMENVACGTSATSRTRRSSGSSARTPASRSISRWRGSPGRSTSCSSIPSGCKRTSTDGRARPLAARASGADPGRAEPRGILCARPAQRDEGVGFRRRAVAARPAEERRRRDHRACRTSSSRSCSTSTTTSSASTRSSSGCSAPSDCGPPRRGCASC